MKRYIFKYRLAITVLLSLVVSACAGSTIRLPETEPVDPKTIREILQQDIQPAPPGPPPFSHRVQPKTVDFDLPETMYSMTLNGVPLSAALEAIMVNTPMNLSVESDVDLSRPVTVHLKQATFSEAMNMVVKNGAGYAWTVDGEMLSITGMMERIYAFDYLDLPGETDIEIGGDMLASSVEDAGVSGKFLLRTKKKEETSDTWSAVYETLKALKSDDGTVQINRTGGLIYLMDRPKKVDAMVRFLDALSEALNRQVFIEAKIMEVRLTDRQQLGIDWTSVNAAFTSSSGFFVDNFNMNFNGGSTLALAGESALGMVVDFLRTQGEVAVISNPHLALMNGRSALLTVGFQFPYGDVDGVDRDEDTKVVTFGTSIKRAVLGLQFGISVQISEQGMVTMNIVPTITRIQEEADVELPTSSTTVQTIKNPIIDLQEIATTVRVQAGNTLVLAGLISQTKDLEHQGLTGLESLPFIGNWFRHVDDKLQTRELVIFITPHMRDRG